MKKVFKKRLIIRSRRVCKFGANTAVSKVGSASDPTITTITVVTTTTGL